ncbi:LTA synthase family protein [Bifidobacterium oedipodis]|uniref:Phosphoglycerol transferase n=1 Tax=Bifidobacterium oedipodis TaxID=2675322 RepID=A0A7Y0ETI0_9BIFI|nr:LTA synthase family protein [Bifidobacterium sp. DSM 109957]NMM95081.1 phosphoglycerol transferase [Bifidobacterium sp. DSM 109957]
MNDDYIAYLTKQGLQLNAPQRDETSAEASSTITQKQKQEQDQQQAQDSPQPRDWKALTKSYALSAWHGIRWAWGKRPRLSFALYFMVFMLVTALSVLLLQASVYESSDQNSEGGTLHYIIEQVDQFVSQIWLNHQYQAILNFLVLGLIYLTLILVLNRFWISTAIFGSAMAAFAVANYFKVQLRGEPLIPSDLNFVASGNTGEIMSFVPKSGEGLVNTAISALIWFVGICIALQILDRRGALIPVRWRPSRFLQAPNIVAACARVLTAGLSVLLTFTLVWNLGIPGSWARQWAATLSDAPQPWNGMGDAMNNGPAMNFLRLVHTKVMDKPESYSKQTMEDLAERYAKKADSINQTREHNLTDSTVIMILSESFSDPTRVPGITFNEDPMPNIRNVKNTTTSGLMLSPGYGGGTANIEYQALTGLDMGNYDPSLQIAYQQLVPKQQWTPTFNQLWNQEYGDQASIALHPYYRAMYFRNTNYKKYGFSQFWAVDGDYKMENLSPIDSAWYASDQSTYQNVLNAIDTDSSDQQFLQVVTMQNHLPYDDWYQNNEFKELDTSEGLSEDERTSVDTYAKGVNITDQETAAFLEQLDQIDKPITVIFYGDHLPGIYSSAAQDQSNTTNLHETDYFIWSNAASGSQGTKLSDETAGYTSSNYFMAQAAEHMNAKVTPYLAFLTEMHQAIAAISTPTASAESGDNPTYMDNAGNVILPEDLSQGAQDMLADYLLIQYDLSAGKHYLKDTDFMGM